MDDWVNKIVDYVNENDDLNTRADDWIRGLYPKIKIKAIDRMLEKELKKSFQTNVKIILIIDELTSEQKDTIRNVINSFKLGGTAEGENKIEFDSYVVRLEQRIKGGSSSSFALSFQG